MYKPLEQQSYHKNTSKCPKPAIPANINIPIPLSMPIINSFPLCHTN